MTTEELIKIKESKTTKPVNHLIISRFSPRFFSLDPVTQDDLELIFEAARLAPSSYNCQPWFFYYATNNTHGFEKLASLLFEGNSWAKQAPVLILSCYIENDARGINSYAKYDLGQAVFSLVIQAQDLGYYTHQMAGFDKERAKSIVIDKNHIPWVMIALGKIGNYQKAPKKIQELDFQKPQRKSSIFLKI